MPNLTWTLFHQLFCAECTMLRRTITATKSGLANGLTRFSIIGGRPTRRLSNAIQRSHVNHFNHCKTQVRIGESNVYSKNVTATAREERITATRGIVNRDRLILVGLGAAFVGYLYFDARKRNERMQFRLKVKQIHESVTKAQNAVNDGQYEEAIKLYKSAMELAKGEPEENVSKTVTLEIVDQLANLAYELRHWEEAEELFKEALQRMLNQGYEKDNDAVIDASLKLAKVYACLGNTSLATDGFQFCMETLDAKIQTLEEIPDDTLALFGMTLTEYGTHYKTIGRLDESEKAFSRALAIAKQVLGPSHEQTSVITNDLATVYDEKGRYNKAERLVQRAISIAKTTSPENLPAYTYNLGAILMHKGEFSRAKKALRQALNLAEENQDEETIELIKNSMLKLDVDT